MTFEQWAARSWLAPQHRTPVRYWKETGNMPPLSEAQRRAIERKKAMKGHAARAAADRLHAFGTELCTCGHRRNAHEAKPVGDGSHDVIDGACNAVRDHTGRVCPCTHFHPR